MFVPLPAYKTGETAEEREDVAGDSKRTRARGSNTEYFVTVCYTLLFVFHWVVLFVYTWPG